MKVIFTKCISCGMCHTVCENDSVVFAKEGSAIILSDKCKDCGECKKVCPAEAIV
jgi:MinD superfamily P-loop ATPase